MHSVIYKQKFYNGILYTDISEHFPIYHLAKTDDHRHEPITFTKFKVNENTLLTLSNELSQVDWNISFDHNTQIAFSDFQRKFQQSFTNCIPKVSYKTKKRNIPWLTTGIIVSIKTKNKLYKKYLKSSTIENQHKYKVYKNKLDHILRIAEKKYYHQFLEDNKNNMFMTWKVINSIIGRNRKQKLHDTFNYGGNQISLLLIQHITTLLWGEA